MPQAPREEPLRGDGYPSLTINHHWLDLPTPAQAKYHLCISFVHQDTAVIAGQHIERKNVHMHVQMEVMDILETITEERI